MSTTSATRWSARRQTDFAGAVAAGPGRDGGEHGLRRRQAGQGARRIPGRDRADGPAGATIRVAVAGRAKVVDDFDGAPTATIALDGLQFTRLAGGRMAGAPTRSISAATEVGRRIVEHLNY